MDAQAAALTYDTTTPPKGCAWAPDGTCLLTAGDDARLRVLELPAPMVAEPPAAPENPAWRPTFDVKACECVYDYAWYPRLHSSQPSTCVFAAAARAAPPALYDAYDGRRRASYCLRDALDEPVPCLALSFSPGGATLRVEPCVEINQCVGCARQFFTKSFLGDDAAVLARSSGEEPASPRHRAGVASMAWRTTR